ncbi:MAG: hypothetical protein ABIH49_02510 [archaeon]
MKNKSIKKGLESYGKVIREHKEKISEEKKKENPNSEMIEYWEKEVKKFTENRDKLMKKIRIS